MCNRLVAGELYDLQDWFSALCARAVEDFAVINKTAFMNAWMDVSGEDKTWLSVLRDVLRMQQNLDLGWILHGTYLSLQEDYSAGGNVLVEFLNHVAGDRWSRMETTMDGKTQAYLDAYPLEPRREDNGIKKEALGTDDALLHEVLATEIPGTAFGDIPKLWMQQMREGFPEIHEGDNLPSTS